MTGHPEPGTTPEPGATLEPGATPEPGVSASGSRPDPPAAPPEASPAPDAAVARRPLIERIGMALIAAVVATTFAGVAAASLSSGEPFLGIMALVGALMTAWVGILTLVRG